MVEKFRVFHIFSTRYYVLNRITLGSPGAAWWTTTQHSPASALRRKPWREEATPAPPGRLKVDSNFT